MDLASISDATLRPTVEYSIPFSIHYNILHLLSLQNLNRPRLCRTSNCITVTRLRNAILLAKVSQV